uniref:Uncharacterized protein n=1 Tax=Anguilla anguilla TaxID=7936 RepID=A0A0E9W781_ANGAN
MYYLVLTFKNNPWVIHSEKSLFWKQNRSFNLKSPVSSLLNAGSLFGVSLSKLN